MNFTVSKHRLHCMLVQEYLEKNLLMSNAERVTQMLSDDVKLSFLITPIGISQCLCCCPPRLTPMIIQNQIIWYKLC